MSDGWDYSAVPPKSWSWSIDDDPKLGCPVDKTVELTRNGLAYYGDALHPNWGGGYTIGSQTYAQFLTDGPLPERMPEETASAIREHLLEHRRAGSRAELQLVVSSVNPGRLERVDCSLDGSPLTTLRPQTEDGEHLFFAGEVAVGDHALRAAFVTPGCGRGIAYANDVALAIAAGTRLRASFAITPAGAEIDVAVEQLD